jgi:tetratricopeptide (TPR) repeat protein
MNVQLRHDLIELLEEDERWSEILDQYISLADAYTGLGDINNARATLNQASQLAQRVGADSNKMVEILHQLADLEMLRLDPRQALRAYENIKHLDPDDEKARKMLVDLNFRLGDPIGAVRDLDGLLQLYAKRRDGQAILKLLEDWVQQRPNDEAIRVRLATVYQQIKRNKDALAQYDALLELQINNGKHADACQTLKKILGLKPDSPQHYLSLVRQLGCA